MVSEKYTRHLNLLEELILTPGISGSEDPIREKIREKISQYGETAVDPMGNLTLTVVAANIHAW